MDDGIFGGVWGGGGGEWMGGYGRVENYNFPTRYTSYHSINCMLT